MRWAARRQAMPSSDSRIWNSSTRPSSVSDTTRAPHGHAHQQVLAFQAVNGFAQWATADAIGAGQFGFGNLAAGRDLALHDGALILRKTCSECFSVAFGTGSAISSLMGFLPCRQSNGFDAFHHSTLPKNGRSVDTRIF
jgi:hypothetical protein